ncbi:MAG: nucleotidyltransferase family protein [Candidatus Verstraetearchaeota archaeon]|nr:nucleotidyltransferase family protein [Candidatus Verstraetearchaeota archaeon]
MNDISVREQRILISLLPALSWEGRAANVEGDLSGGLDWGALLSLAHRNRIFLQVYERLQSVLSRQDNDSYLKSYRPAYLQMLSAQLARRSEYKKAMKALARAGVSFLPFKGVLLDSVVYPPGVMRDYSDMDLLIPNRKELARARDLLERLGYRKLVSGSDAYHVKMVKEGRNRLELSVELHSRLPGVSHLFGYPAIDGLWESASRVEAGGIRFGMVPPESMVLVTAMNAFRDGEVKLRDLCDIDAISARFPNLDWGAISRRLSSPSWWGVIALPVSLYRWLLESLGRGVPSALREIPMRIPDEMKVSFPVRFSSVCGVSRCPGGWCRGCPIYMQRRLPPFPELLTINDAFRSFPERVKLNVEFISTAVVREAGTPAALKCYRELSRYLMNVTFYLLRSAPQREHVRL